MATSSERKPEDRSGSGPLVRQDYEDESGRMWAVAMPSDSDFPPSMGIPIGPPDSSGLHLPEETAVRLHNQLHARGMFTKRDIKGRHKEVFAAVQAAFKVDVAKVTELFN
ncbi:hypothetical protein LCGC14_0353700 [marine sediment metagenome]|uniref:Uncharacterized protein n=1 Tax=marine sediment metagenome TaxID=412755 RepID=A0A0F9WI91_9ZZZZ